MATLSQEQRNISDALRKEAEKIRKLAVDAEASFEKSNHLAQWTTDLAILNGMSANRPTVSNAQAFIESDYLGAKATVENYEQLATDAGYASVPKAFEALRRTSGETRNKKTLTYFRETLPDGLGDETLVLKRLAGDCGQRKVDRFLTEALYPRLEELLHTNPEPWVIENYVSNMDKVESMNDLSKIHMYLIDRLEGVAPEFTSDLINVKGIVSDAYVDMGFDNSIFNPRFIEDILAVCEAGDFKVERSVSTEIKGRHALARIGWVCREFLGFNLDQRVSFGLAYANYGQVSDNGQSVFFSPKVTLDLYLECVEALKAQETDFVFHEDAYECVEQAIRLYEKRGIVGENVRSLIANQPSDSLHEAITLDATDDELLESLSLLEN